MAAVLAGIRERAPAARILVVGYPVILPAAGPGCWPLMPIAVGDVAWLRTVQGRLNAMLAEQAAAAGATFVDTYTSSVGHDVCRLPGAQVGRGPRADGAGQSRPPQRPGHGQQRRAGPESVRAI